MRPEFQKVSTATKLYPTPKNLVIYNQRQYHSIGESYGKNLTKNEREHTVAIVVGLIFAAIFSFGTVFLSTDFKNKWRICFKELKHNQEVVIHYLPAQPKRKGMHNGMPINKGMAPINHNDHSQVDPKTIRKVYSNLTMVDGCQTASPMAKTAQKTNYSVGTYNILFPQKQGEHNKPYSTNAGYYYDPHSQEVRPNDDFRLKIIKKNILNANLDVNCLQEVTPEVFASLQKDLATAGYQGIYAAHSPTAKKTHGVGIFFKQNRFSLLNAYRGQFSYHKVDAITGQHVNHPDGKPAMKKRAHLMLDLQDRNGGKISRIVSCHLEDPRIFPVQEKALQTEAIVKHTAKKVNYVVDQIVIAGDMNQDQYGDYKKGEQGDIKFSDLRQATSFQPLLKKEFKVLNLHPQGSTEYSKDIDEDDLTTYNDFALPTGRTIDHIWVKASNVRLSELKPHAWDNRGSDHKYVMLNIG